MALAELPPTAVLFDQFRKGIQLTAFAQGNRYDFRLDGTYAALTEIGNCALRYSGRTPPASAPPAPMASSTPAPPMGQPLSAEQRLEATTLVANLFSQGELTGYKILSAKDIQELRLPTLSTWHVVWRAGDIVGTMRIVPPQSAPSAGAISSDIIGSDSKGCTGKFASGTNPDDKNQGTTRIFTACRTEMFLTEGHYIIVPREAGGYYLFGTFGQAPVTATGGGTKGTSEATSSSHADGLLRAAVFEVLKH